MAKLKALGRSSPASNSVQRSDGSIELTAFPRKQRAAHRRYQRARRARKWDVKELYAEAGRLDEVFRALTTHDARARAGRAPA